MVQYGRVNGPFRRNYACQGAAGIVLRVDRLKEMWREVIARGRCINDATLTAALCSRTIAGAGIDSAVEELRVPTRRSWISH